MLAHGGLHGLAVAILVDRLRTLERRVAEIAEVLDEVAPVVVERHHQRVIGLDQPIEQNAARIIMVPVGVPHGEQRRDRLHSRMASAGEEIGRRAHVRDAG